GNQAVGWLVSQQRVAQRAPLVPVPPAPPGSRRPDAPTVQRAGGWSDADTAVGKGLAKGGSQSGWNVEGHAVGTIRRIPLDGLTGGLQGAQDESKGAKELSDEGVTGAVKGQARTGAAKKATGRAIALVPSHINTDDAVTVFFHLHGNTENASRGFGGWRQHK